MMDDGNNLAQSEAGDDEGRFVELLDGYWDQGLSEDDTQVLSAMLVADAGRRTLFVDIATQRNALTEIYHNEEYAKLAEYGWPTSAHAAAGSPHINRWSRLASTLAVSLVIYGGFFLLAWGIWRNDVPEDDVPSSGTIATVEVEEDSHWRAKPENAQQDKLKPGVAIASGQPLELLRGRAEIELENGVRLSLEAPCRVRMEAVDRVKLEEGRIYAVVPRRGAGFTVETPLATFVDRGTRFGVEVSADRGTSLHVFEGRVDSFASGDANRSGERLVAGESIRFAGDQVRRAAADSQPFRQVMALAQRQRESKPAKERTPTKAADVAQAAGGEKKPEQSRDDNAVAPDRATLLVELEPSQIEYGLTPDPNKSFTAEGRGAMDPRCGGVFWPKDRKIVKSIPADAAVPKGQPYRTALYNDFFAVGGDFVTGVGFWARSRCMYHWLEYEIPTGATRFTGKLLVSDDPTNAEYPSANQNFYFIVTIDGKEVVKEGKLLPTQVFGSGQKLTDLNFAIPAGAKTIRFRLESTPWGDGNLNNEVIVSEGAFTIGQSK